jgi:hypothetical protein
MKNLISNRTKKIIIGSLLCFLPVLLLFSQPGPPDPGGPPSGPPLPHQDQGGAPIDRGLGIMLMMGGGYAVLKWVGRKKRQIGLNHKNS